MKKSLSHLPKHKQDELEIIRDIILENVPDVQMVILFGSFARNEWVEDTHIEDNATHVYQSDFDIIVVTESKKRIEDFKLHNNIKNAIEETKQVKTPYTIIYHDFGYVQQMINQGHYFFTDIKNQGIHLYTKKGKYSLEKAKLLTTEERKQIAEEHFDMWFNSAKEFYVFYEVALKRRKYKEAAFVLHQAVERFYSSVTLVFVNYRFKIHDLEILDRKAVGYNSEFAMVFPQDTDEQKKMFDLLRRAYIDARYKKDYKITKKQLEYLAKRVKLLQRLTKKICAAKIESFV